MKNKGRGKSERYVKLRLWLLDAPAWKSLPANARALYIELARRYNGSNNGRISYSTREAGQSLHISPCTAGRLLRILQGRGFIVCTKRGAFSLKTGEGRERVVSDRIRLGSSTCARDQETSCAGSPRASISTRLTAGRHTTENPEHGYPSDTVRVPP